MKAHWMRLRPKVLRRIKPTPGQTRRAQQAAQRLSQRARQEASAAKIRIRPFIVGSLAKQTHLRPRPDIDLFLLFPTDVPRQQLERVGLRIGRRILNQPRLRYAEHPYVRGQFGGYEFDVVPAYQVESGEGRMSAVDRSPFHAQYVKKRLSARQRDEVRLLKQFLKGIGCYGAETATGGFSGYLAELLILRYGTFWDALMELREQVPPILLSLEGDAPLLGGDMVFIDPVDPSRNAAAAVGRERLETFLRAARAFTAQPRLEFFWPRAPRVQTRAELYSHLSHRGVVGLQVRGLSVREEARLPHMRRFAEKVVRALEEEGFRVVRHAVYEVTRQRLLALWEHEPVALPPDFVHHGPPVGSGAHEARFLEKWRASSDAMAPPEILQGRWQVRVRRKERDAVDVLGRRWSELLKGLDVPDRLKSGVMPQRAMELAQVASLRPALTRFLLPRDPWDPS